MRADALLRSQTAGSVKVHCLDRLICEIVLKFLWLGKLCYIFVRKKSENLETSGFGIHENGLCR